MLWSACAGAPDRSEPVSHGGTGVAPGTAPGLVGIGPLKRVLPGGDEVEVDLRGRPTVCLFWTPLCGPSRDSLHAMGELAPGLVDEGWRFVAVTFHGAEEILEAMGEMNLPADGPVLMCRDDFGSAFRRMGVDGTPVAAVFDAAGTSIGLVHPSHLTAEGLRAAQSSGELDAPRSDLLTDTLAPDAWDLRRIQLEGDAAPIATMERVPSPGQFMRFDPVTGIITAPGAAPRSLLRSALDLPASRFVWVGIEEGDEPYYDVKIVPHDGVLDTARRQLLSMLRAETGWSWRSAIETRDAWVIEAAPGSGPRRADPGEASVRWMGPTFDGTATIADLGAWLESITGTPVVDGTGLGSQLFDLQLVVRSRAELEPAFAKVGLTLRRTTADIECVHVTGR